MKTIHISFTLAIVGVQNVQKNPIKTFDTNLISTLNILKAFENKEKKPLIIFFSTSEVYQPLLDNKTQISNFRKKKQKFTYPTFYLILGNHITYQNFFLK